MAQDEGTLLPAVVDAGKLNKSSRSLQVRRGEQLSADYVPHLNLDDVKRLSEAAGQSRNGERNRLLVQLLFDGCLRCSEAIGVRPQDIVKSPTGWYINVLGKGSKYGIVAISASLAAQLQAYAYRHSIPPTDRIFKINRTRVFQIVKAAMTRAGIVKPDGVGSVHVLRHSGAIERLKRTRNPRATQDQLRHKSALMTLRYLKTLSHEESMEIQQEVEYDW